MYDFVFFYFYSVYKKSKNGGERGTAITFAFFTQAVHFGLIFGLIKMTYAIATKGESMPDGGIFKIILPNHFWGMFTIGLPWIFILYRYYTPERIMKIEEHYTGIKILTVKNFLKILLLIIVPVLIGIKVSNFTAHYTKAYRAQAAGSLK